jgi:26S proteasome regulatory subunit N12
MASIVADCAAATAELSRLLNANDLRKAEPVMQRIKLLMIQFSVSGGAATRSELVESEIAAGVSALEAFVVHSVKSSNAEAFARYFAQLRSFYSLSSPEATPGQPKVLGLNLLRLLVDNSLAEFHSELELVPQECVGSPFVQFPVQLERSLMEGLFKHVLQARQNFPDPLFAEYLGGWGSPGTRSCCVGRRR